VDEVEDPLLVELVGIVELTRDNPPAVGEGLDEGVDERLIVETRVAAGGVPGVVALESAEMVDDPVGLRAMVVREDREILAKGDWVGVSRCHETRDRHGLGATCELPEQLVAAAQGNRWTRRRPSIELVRELDTVDHLVLEARALSDVELVAVTVARP